MRARASDPDRPVFRADPSRLFPFQQRWERPDPNPFPQFRVISRPLAWRAALSRCMDELGVVRDRSA